MPEGEIVNLISPDCNWNLEFESILLILSEFRYR